MKPMPAARFSLPLLFLLLASPAFAQSAPDYPKLLQQYANEHAIFIYRREHITLTNDGGELKATSRVEEEQLLCSDAAPQLFNDDLIYHGSFKAISNIDAATLKPASGGDYDKIKATETKTTRSENESVFYDDAKQTRVFFPALVKGARKRLRYDVAYDDIHFLPGWYFQTYMPILESELSITAPKGVEIGRIIRGLNTSAIEEKTSPDGNRITYTWRARNLPALRIWSGAPPLSSYQSHVLPFVKSYAGKGGNSNTVFGSIKDLYRYYYPHIAGLNATADAGLTGLAKELSAGQANVTAKAKAKAIYEWVQQHVRYVAFEDGMGGFVPRQANLICERRFGDCKDMTSIQVGLARLMGVPAYFTWIGTRAKPYTYEGVPLPVVDNHMICAVKLDGKWIFMDGTDPSTPFGYAPAGIQGKEALIGIDSAHYEIVKVPELAASESVSADSTMLRLDADNVLKGFIRVRNSGYPAWMTAAMLRYYNPKELEDKLKAMLFRGSNKLQVRNATYAVLPTAKKDLSIAADVELSDYVRKAGKDLYLNMNLLRSYGTAADTSNNRPVGLENEYKQTLRQVTVLDIPAGYKVSFLPEAATGGAPGLLRYTVKYTAKGNKVFLEKEIEVQALNVPIEKLADWNRATNELARLYKATIVLTAG